MEIIFYHCRIHTIIRTDILFPCVHKCQPPGSVKHGKVFPLMTVFACTLHTRDIGQWFWRVPLGGGTQYNHAEYINWTWDFGDFDINTFSMAGSSAACPCMTNLHKNGTNRCFLDTFLPAIFEMALFRPKFTLV